MKIIVHPAAIADLNNAAVFYFLQVNKKLSLTRIAEFEKAASLLSENRGKIKSLQRTLLSSHC